MFLKNAAEIVVLLSVDFFYWQVSIKQIQLDFDHKDK